MRQAKHQIMANRRITNLTTLISHLFHLFEALYAVDGFLDFFACHIEEKTHILVTATPTEEINEILKALNIRHFFSNVYGAPQAKSHVIEETLRTLDVGFNRAIMLGDSESDYRAAEENNVLFLLRGTDLNNKYVLTVDEQNKVQYRAITLGDKVGELRVIKQGLKSGERIVVNGLQRVRSGVLIKPELINMAKQSTLNELQAWQQKVDNQNRLANAEPTLEIGM